MFDFREKCHRPLASTRCRSESARAWWRDGAGNQFVLDLSIEDRVVFNVAKRRYRCLLVRNGDINPIKTNRVMRTRGPQDMEDASPHIH